VREIEAYDDQDRLLTYGGVTFTYTANGEIRTKTDSTGTTTYTYDAMGSLIGVNLPDGRLIEYVTDGKGRRIGKMVNGVLTKQWIYRDQLKQVAELDSAGNLVGQFIYGTKANVPVLVIRSGVSYRVISDQLGSPVLAVNVANSSDIQFQATYSAFGERTLVAGTDDWMPFGFAGGIYDLDTKLTRFGAREFNATLGRWVSKDPIRFEGRQANIYVYVRNDPVNKRDPSGLSSGKECRTICLNIATDEDRDCPLMCALTTSSFDTYTRCRDSCHTQVVVQGADCQEICDSPDPGPVECENNTCYACSDGFGLGGG
jgi:RHS repeat-associated protein